ncbi:UBX domain-containing protein 4-like isoform X2 [Tigriopus californicus]|uniref:UBX domain-containing protein 4-like isoform X2 n=1 Tax=Tigriopus californicus TaxID=6832 RepID=UPI0027DA2F1D|nr:UBX domain-containing protein 4-like isoform X2 [Tigriopus californicus]
MDWFEGSITEAIGSAKSRQRLFVVVVFDGESDEALLATLNAPDLAPSFQTCVCIRLKNGSPLAEQFAQIYPVVLVPSIFFINSANGMDLEVTGGVQLLQSQNIAQSLAKAQARFAQTSPSPPVTAAGVTAESVASPRGQRVMEASQSLQNSAPRVEVASPAPLPSPAESLEARVARAKRLMAERQGQKKEPDTEKIQAEAPESSERGVNPALEEAAAERKRDMEEKKLAKERVLRQIEQDRAERAQKFQTQKREETEKKERLSTMAREAREAEEMAKSHPSTARVQFRYPDGRSRVQRLPVDSDINSLFATVADDSERSPALKEFSLSTTFPSKCLDTLPRSTTLRECNLVPSGTVLVLPKRGQALSSRNTSVGLLSYLLLTPFTFLWGLISSFWGGTGEAPNLSSLSRPSNNSHHTTNPTSSRQSDPASGTTNVRRRGNVSRLADLSDDDQDNKTWNGNSTQQM